MNHIKHFIDGNLVSFEEENLKVYNPASGEIKSTVSIASKETVAKAITSSKCFLHLVKTQFQRDTSPF